jgi:hypothetical protein
VHPSAALLDGMLRHKADSANALRVMPPADSAMLSVPVADVTRAPVSSLGSDAGGSAPVAVSDILTGNRKQNVALPAAAAVRPELFRVSSNVYSHFV